MKGGFIVSFQLIVCVSKDVTSTAIEAFACSKMFSLLEIYKKNTNYKSIFQNPTPLLKKRTKKKTTYFLTINFSKVDVSSCCHPSISCLFLCYGYNFFGFTARRYNLIKKEEYLANETKKKNYTVLNKFYLLMNNLPFFLIEINVRVEHKMK